jgi:hypothetical protein
MRCKASQHTEINRHQPQIFGVTFQKPSSQHTQRTNRLDLLNQGQLLLLSNVRIPAQRWMSAPLVLNENYFLASRPRNDILERLNLNHIYEKICLVINHRPNRHRVYCFLHATAGDNCNPDNSGNGQGLAVAIAGKKEEDHHEEEGNDRRIAFACGGCRIAFADALKNVEARS